MIRIRYFIEMLVIIFIVLLGGVWPSIFTIIGLIVIPAGLVLFSSIFFPYILKGRSKLIIYKNVSVLLSICGLILAFLGKFVL